jgi:hypothetical protein
MGPILIGEYFSGINLLGRESIHSLQSSGGVKNDEAYVTIAYCLFRRRDKYSFNFIIYICWSTS